MLARIVEAADRAVARTRNENPTNKAAGVVDAGAKGLYCLLEGLLAAAEGRPIASTRTTVTPAPSAWMSSRATGAGACTKPFCAGTTRPTGRCCARRSKPWAAPT